MKQCNNVFRQRRNGFTFVELLVVVTLIVILSAIGLASYSQVNQKSRDSKRRSDLEQIRAALEIYRSDQGIYPAAAVSPIDGELDTEPCGGTLKSSLGTETYMDPIPCDPRNDGPYSYTYSRPTTTTYTLEATMEIDDKGEICGTLGDSTYCVKQP